MQRRCREMQELVRVNPLPSADEGRTDTLSSKELDRTRSRRVSTVQAEHSHEPTFPTLARLSASRPRPTPGQTAHLT